MANFPRDQQRPRTENNTSPGLLAREKWINNPSSLDLLAHRPIACSFLLSLWLIFAFYLIRTSAMAPRIFRGSYCENVPPFPVNAFDRDLSDCPKMTKWIRFAVNGATFSFSYVVSVKFHFAIIIRSCRDTGFQTPCVCTNTTPLSMYKVTFPKEYKAFPSKRLLGIGMNKRLLSSAYEKQTTTKS